MKWSDVSQFLVTVFVVVAFFLGCSASFVAGAMIIALIVGFVWGESPTWQALVEACAYSASVIALFTSDDPVLIGVVLVVTSIVSLFANFGSHLGWLSKN